MRGPFPVILATLSAPSIASATMCSMCRCGVTCSENVRDACRTPPDARHVVGLAPPQPYPRQHHPAVCASHVYVVLQLPWPCRRRRHRGIVPRLPFRAKILIFSLEKA